MDTVSTKYTTSKKKELYTYAKSIINDPIISKEKRRTFIILVNEITRYNIYKKLNKYSNDNFYNELFHNLEVAKRIHRDQLINDLYRTNTSLFLVQPFMYF